MKLVNDKYYTPLELSDYCCSVVKSFISNPSIVIEPSAGNGSFICAIDKYFKCDKQYYDLYPEHSLVLKQDYTKFELEHKPNIVVIGNPPFGNRNNLIIKFFKKSIEFADYIAFILPISQLNNTKQLYEFDLIHSEDLGIQNYSGVDLHCCFNIYKRPNSGVLNKKPKMLTIEGLEVIEYRRDKEDSYRKKIKDGYFHSIGSWGNGCVGVIPEHIGKFSMELYFYSDDKRIIDIVKSIDWLNELSSISAKKLPKGLALEIIKSKL